MTSVVLVEGTFGGDWAEPGSAFCRFLEQHDVEPRLFEGWTTNVDGVPNILAKGRHRDWIAGGYALGYLLDQVPYEARNIICHSHGLNVVLYELERYGQPIRRLISVCSPVRGDMQHVADVARVKIGRWRHLASHDGDVWQRAGELFDGHFGWGERKWSQADENVLIHGIGHSKLLNDPRLLDLWSDAGMLDFLRATEVVGV